MPISYIKLEVEMHGLKIKNNAELRELLQKIMDNIAQVRNLSPYIIRVIKGDVVIDLIEFAGNTKEGINQKDFHLKSK